MSADWETSALTISPTPESDRRATLHLRGTIDLATTARLSAAVAAQLAAGRSELTLDLSAVRFAGVSALEAMLAARQRCVAAGGCLGLSHIPPIFHRVLAVTGLRWLFAAQPESQAGYCGHPAAP